MLIQIEIGTAGSESKGQRVTPQLPAGFKVHIVNIMFSCNSGGIEQAFVDYCEGLLHRGHRITAITHPDAPINTDLKALNIDTLYMKNLGEWDIFAARKLRQQLQILAPDIVIGHASRAFILARKAINGFCPLVGIAHNYNARIRKLTEADGAFATTQDLIKFVAKQGVAEDRIFLVPNMVRCHELPHRGPRHQPPVIGTMGRFVKKKGFDVFIDAITILRNRGYQFRAAIGGNGVEEAALKKKASAAGLDKILMFPGWIEDKRAFFHGIDIFCLPSLHEPFGIVLLESFIHGVPVVSTDSEGPRDFITPNFDALIVKKGDAVEMADALAKLLDSTRLADDLAANAFAKAKTKYSIDGVSENIEKALLAIIARWRSQRLTGRAA